MSVALDRFAAAVLDPARPVPEGVVGPGGQRDGKRFAVYRNNVFVSLVGALEARFPVARRLVGDEFFRGMARSYVALHRPTSPILMHYGDDFPDYIAGFQPADMVPYLADVARVEAKWTDAYNAADALPLQVSAFGAVPPERLTEVRLKTHPAAALLTSPFPAGSIWAAHQTETIAPVRAAGGETVLIARPAIEVVVHVLPGRDAGFAARLLAGESIGTALAGVPADFDFGTALVGLIGLGAFSTYELGEESGQ